MKTNLVEKNNIYQVILSWNDKNGKRRQKWVSTGLKVSGNNKRKAEQLKAKIQQEWEPILTLENYENILFSEYILNWLEDIKHTLSQSSYINYKTVISGVIAPYFKQNNIKLSELKAYHIQDFYNFKMRNDNISANTILHYHAYINRALNYAVKSERIPKNPALNVDLPKKQKHRATWYTVSELKTLLDKISGCDIEPTIMLAAYLGLRRGEISGLKWDCIDFENKTLTIKGTIVKSSTGWMYSETAKTETSLRTLPMPDNLVIYLWELKQKQEQSHKEMQKQGKYTDKWRGFVCVKENGQLILPDYITRHFKLVCKEAGLKEVNFHGLRHSNISMLLSNGFTPKDVQGWAGHSTLSVTADIYGHIPDENKLDLSYAVNSLLTS